jgi:hypothetical protein
MHGWAGMDPHNTYILWINHIVQKGNIVVFPRYQASILTDPATFTNNSVIAIKNAITTLQSGGHVVPNLDCTAILGHSFGGVLSANLAAVAEERGLPVFSIVMAIEPGTAGFGVYENFSNINADTYMLCIAGENDTNVGDTDAKRIFYESTQIPLAYKDYILIYNDKHGTPNLIANHFIPMAGGSYPPDVYDWYGFWKWFDGLSEGVFYGRNLNYAIGKTAEQKYLGEWSDGIPVKQPLVTDSP